MKILRDTWAVALREWKIARRYPSLWLLVAFGPILTTLPWVFVARQFADKSGVGTERFVRLTGTDNYIGFIVLGAIFYGFILDMFQQVGSSLHEEAQRGTLERNFTTPVRVSALLLGRGLAHGSVVLPLMLQSLALCWLVLGLSWDVPILSGLFVLFVSLWAIYGFILLIAALMLSVKEPFGIMDFINLFLPVLSGVTFPIVLYPFWLQRVCKAVPLTWAIDSLRQTVLNGISVWSQGALPALFLLGLTAMLFGHWILKRTIIRQRRSGRLGFY